jgi:deoxyribodipyrimidine photolyase-related protein
MDITVLFPIDLYKDITLLYDEKVFLVEDMHYFNRSSKKDGGINFNILKPIYHRATMKSYYDYLISNGINCQYIDLTKNWIDIVKKHNIKNGLRFYDPVDRKIEKIISKNFDSYDIITTPRFILSNDELDMYNGALRQTSFYSWIRKLKNILMTKGGPEGGELTYDNENRKTPYEGIENDINDKVKKNCKTDNNKYLNEAISYVKKTFDKSDFISHSEGSLCEIKFPIDHKGSLQRLKYFIKTNIVKFGDYQDVILYDEHNSFIFHSALSPMINIGLITPNDIIKTVIKYYEKLSAKEKLKRINSVEGFIRQILGWREFSRYMYEKHSHMYLNKNFFNATKKLGKEWYNGTTNILPIDVCIRKAFKFGYLHHIERLMIMANYMTLLGIHPKEIYKWFYSFSLDSYDWVMEYNIFCMATYSDGGQFTSKPYISSSKYILKMSNYKKKDGLWTNEWDKLFWNFLKKHKNKIKKIGRLSMLLKFIPT